jgi:thiol-disulfide isomerase/thioredoxin
MTGPKMPRAKAMRAEMKRKEARRRQFMISGAVIGVVIIVVVVLVVVKVAGGGNDKSAAATAASSSVVNQITTVPASVSEKAGDGGTTKPNKVTGQPALTSNGKPELFYFGAEWCPFCAAQRWPMAVALSRFGTLSNLGQTHSAKDDGDIPTLSFHGSTYTSKYLTFTPIESQDVNHNTLDTPTAEQQKLVNTLDTPQFVGGDTAGAIPFITYGNLFASSGSSFDPNVLSGKSHQEIAKDIHNGSGDIGKNVNGAANVITATICQMTKNQPSNVCSTPAVQKIEGSLGAG